MFTHRRAFYRACAISLLGLLWIGSRPMTAQAQSGYFSGGFPVFGGYSGAFRMGGTNPSVNFFNANLLRGAWFAPGGLLGASQSFDIRVTPFYIPIPVDPWTGTPVDPSNPAEYGIPRTDDTFVVEKDKEGKLTFRWDGEPRAVKQITVFLLDGDRKELKKVEITKMPPEAKLEPNDKAKSYKVVVEYINGTKTSISSPL